MTLKQISLKNLSLYFIPIMPSEIWTVEIARAINQNEVNATTHAVNLGVHVTIPMPEYDQPILDRDKVDAIVTTAAYDALDNVEINERHQPVVKEGWYGDVYIEKHRHYLRASALYETHESIRKVTLSLNIAVQSRPLRESDVSPEEWEQVQKARAKYREEQERINTRFQQRERERLLEKFGGN